MKTYQKIALLFVMVFCAAIAIAQTTILVPDSTGGFDTLILAPGVPIGDQVTYNPGGAFAVGGPLASLLITLLVYLSYFIKPLRKLKLDDARVRSIIIGLIVVGGFAAFKPGDWLKTVFENLDQILVAAGSYSLIFKKLFGASNPDQPAAEGNLPAQG